MNGLKKLVQNIELFEGEVEAIRARATMLSIYLSSLKSDLEKAVKMLDKEGAQ